MTLQNLWDAAKANLRGKFIAIQAYLRKQTNEQTKNPQINKIISHLKQVEREQTRPKVSRRKEIKIRAKINEIERK